jgi:antitoxin (DNA-binding transcriptional repressor) of toxin-antitoxin stability system
MAKPFAPPVDARFGTGFDAGFGAIPPHPDLPDDRRPVCVNVHEAKSQLSQLLLQVEAGATVVIGRAGVPVAELRAWRPAPVCIRNPGSWAGRLQMQQAFNRPFPGAWNTTEARSGRRRP